MFGGRVSAALFGDVGESGLLDREMRRGSSHEGLGTILLVYFTHYFESAQVFVRLLTVKDNIKTKVV